ncbi:hypothetical protein MCP_2470 [Methanocella paludicola SANAE]|uniref:Uncharacterized protein n=1 Tax=Methanocella paludicola (strain DSM 17711 / JCM 13418 / NBRC 101707 / SANAE) TaxID=304371 RepID=D1Z1H0_METPS|nr:hypothetical protein [Methanocella paludicola]BAI62542.1 hypothetical protein MCP_2470 [Methanocella paludicola SANAE]
MCGRHNRSVSAAATTILGYIREIRSLMASGDQFHSSLKGRPTAEEVKEINNIMAGMERAIEDYWGDSGLPQEETDVKWRIYVLSQFMEDLVDDMRPEKLRKTHGDIESDEQAEKMGELCDRLDEQVRRLKRIASK